VFLVENSPNLDKDEINNSTIAKDPNNSTAQNDRSLKLKIKEAPQTIIKNIKSLIFRWYLRDFNITSIQVLDMIIRGLIVSATMTFWITTTLDGLPHIEFDYNLVTSIIIVGGLAMLFGGIVTDFFVKMKYLYELIAIIATLPMILMLFLDGIVVIVAAFILGIFAAFLLILFFTSILTQTNLLNRGRMFTLVLIIMAIFTGPIISLIIIIDSHYWVIGVIIALSLCSVLLRKKRFESIYDPVQAEYSVKLGIKEYWKTMGESGAWPYFFFLSFSATVIGFYTSSAISTSMGTAEIVTLCVVGVLSLPLVCGILDNVGRKPAGYIVLFLLGIFTIFFDYPSISPTGLNELKIGVYLLTAFLILLITAVVPGDLSSGISRGKITGAFLFATVFGALIGSMIRLSYFSNTDFENLDTVIRISDWTTLLIFLAMFIYSKSRDPFQEETPDWRNYLDGLYIISSSGLSLFHHRLLNKASDKDMNEDLVSGGITGIQGMLKEIAHSDKNIEVVNHGDLQLLFHYGKWTTAVLFVKKDLIVLREKLAFFHNSFEQKNKNLLPEFNGDISSLIGLKDLTKKYFI
jgi:MFS family permease